MSSRIYQPPDAVLFSMPIQFNASVQTPPSAEFRVTTPSARVQLKLSILFWQQVTGQPSAVPTYLDPFFFGASGIRMTWGLYLATADRTPVGSYAATGNVVGTIGPSQSAHTYQTIPVDGPTTATLQQTLAGFSQTFQDGQDAIVGAVQSQVVFPMGATHRGINCSLRARWEEIGTTMCEDEWKSLVGKMQVAVPDTFVYST